MTLILGGARSGKSSHAQKLAADSGKSVLYVATAEARDQEMATRIAAHRAERPANWRTLEAPVDVGEAIRASIGASEIVLVDCITLLASNIIAPLPETVSYENAEKALLDEIEALRAAYAASTAHWILVSNEVGLGLVPPYPLGRRYRDALGRANQRLAEMADDVFFMIAGLPMALKKCGGL
jgi:adenosylcobinamide kinase/adenosylcobinamide-phosphate guanylyltransferase